MLASSFCAAVIAMSVVASDVDWSVRVRVPLVSRGFVRDERPGGSGEPPVVHFWRKEADVLSLVVGRRFAPRWLAEASAGLILGPINRLQATLLAGRVIPLLNDPVERPGRSSLELQLLGGLLYRHSGKDWHSNSPVGQRTLAAAAQAGLDATWPRPNGWAFNLRGNVGAFHALVTDAPATWSDSEGGDMSENFRYGVNYSVDLGVTF